MSIDTTRRIPGIKPGDSVEIEFDIERDTDKVGLSRYAIGEVIQVLKNPSKEAYKIWTYEPGADNLGYVWRVVVGGEAHERVHRSKSRIEPDTAVGWLGYEKTMFVWKQLNNPDVPAVTIEVNP
jgi:hypothetical protein